MNLDRVVLGWRETRETRRAALDALPLMKRAAHVTVTEVADDENLADARERPRSPGGWPGTPSPPKRCGSGPPALGRVTRDLLLRGGRCTMLSH